MPHWRSRWDKGTLFQPEQSASVDATEVGGRETGVSHEVMATWIRPKKE